MISLERLRPVEDGPVDALRTRRSYREALDHELIRGYMPDIPGSYPHPGLTRNFLHTI